MYIYIYIYIYIYVYVSSLPPSLSLSLSLPLVSLSRFFLPSCSLAPFASVSVSRRHSRLANDKQLRVHAISTSAWIRFARGRSRRRDPVT